MAARTTKPRAPRKVTNATEEKLGVRGTSAAFDYFSNSSARMGFGTPSLGQGAEYTLERFSFNYWSLITLFRNHWISRKIVEVPAQDMIKAWPKLTSDIAPKELTKLDRAIRKTNTKNNLLTSMTWGRLFGGAGGLMVVDGQESELDQPLDLESIGIGAYKGVIPFDMWAGVHPTGAVCTDINRPLDFNKPEMYEVTISGGESFKVHASRLLRFLGPVVPTPELQAQSYWGISVLEPVYEAITKLDNMSWNILSLTFRANLLGMEFPQLDQLLSGLGGSQVANQKFEQRLSAMNHLMSNQSLIPLPKDGDIKAATYSFGGLSDIFQLFQLDLSGASGIPVARLWGRTYNGLGQTGDGDEKIYEEKIASDQAAYLAPQLEKLYPVICMSELGEVPDDLDLSFPSIRVLDEKEKAELAKATADSATVWVNLGVMSQRVAGQELKQSSDVTGFGTNMTDEEVDKLPDTVAQEGELGGDLFGGEGAGLNEADSPAKAIKSEMKVGEGQDPDEPGGAKKALAEKAGKKQSAAPAMDALPANIFAGETLLVGGKMLKVAKVVRGTKDLFGEPTVQVHFDNGEVVAYRVAARAEDAVRYKTSHLRGPSFITQNGAGRRMESADGSRWAISTNRKRALANHRFDSVEVWTLKRRSDTGVAETFAVNRSEEDARRFVEGGAAIDEDGPSTAHEGMRLYHGLLVRVETPKGGVRTGKGWRTEMPADYGYIDGVVGADFDSLDCYVGDHPEALNAYVVDQYDLDGRTFDEHKVIFGAHTLDTAKEIYMDGHHKSGKTFAAITPFTMPMFRKWMAEHDMAEPCDPKVRV